MSIDEKRLTIDDFHEFILRPENQDRRWELVDGELIEMPSSSKINTIIAGIIAYYFNFFALDSGLGHVSVPDGGYQLNENTVRQPDVGFISKDRLKTLEGVTFEVAPDIAVEMISPSETLPKVRRKIDDYLSAGTKQVWVVYPEDKVIEIWQLAPDGSKNVRTLGIEDTLTAGDVLPKFEVALKKIFREEHTQG